MDGDKLKIVKTSNADLPLTQGMVSGEGSEAMNDSINVRDGRIGGRETNMMPFFWAPTDAVARDRCVGARVLSRCAKRACAVRGQLPRQTGQLGLCQC